MLVPGTRLGAYEIVSALGTGGMGEVYKARDTRLDRTVAVKILSSEIASFPELRERFEREARTVASRVSCERVLVAGGRVSANRNL